MKASRFNAIGVGGLGFIILIVYLMIVLPSKNQFVNGFLTCLVIVLLLILVLALRLTPKNYLSAVTLDPEYVHFYYISQRVTHIRLSEVKRITFVCATGRSAKNSRNTPTPSRFS